MIIGLSGMPAAGKDTVAEYLQKNGFEHFSLSQILREVLKERKIEINIENLTSLGNKIGTELVERAISRLDRQKNTVISSVRQVAEIKKLRGEENFHMLFVDADPQLRFERLRKRGRSGDSETFQQFCQIEERQMGIEGGMNLRGCKKLSDFVLINDSTLEELYKQIDEVLSKIKESA